MCHIVCTKGSRIKWSGALTSKLEICSFKRHYVKRSQ